MASAPNLRELVESTGTKIDDWFYNPTNPQYEQNQKLLADASSALYGNVGANLDTRNWDQILASDNTIQAANDALAAMYSDPSYREQNTANLVQQGYKPAQAYYTYNQMNDRVGASYVPTLNEVNAVNDYFKALGLPGEKWSFDGSKVTTNKATTNPATTTSTTTPNTTTAQQGGVVPRVMGPLPSGSAGDDGFNTWRAGAAGNDMLGAGNANYHSELLKSLRQSSINPISNNQGVQFIQNQGANSTNWTPPGNQGLAFNPQVLNPRAASAQEVADWNAYNTYRTNALNAKTPVLSMAEWLTKGKSDGQPVTPEITPEVANWSGY